MTLAVLCPRPAAGPVLQVLRSLKVIRGTPLDLLGLTRVRRIERELVNHYVAMIEAVAAQLGRMPHGLAVELAGAPDMVRGYEHIKLDNVAKYLAHVGGLQRRLGVAVPLGRELSSLPVAPGEDTPAFKAA